MFKLSVVDTRAQRRLVLEGKLTAPWTATLRCAWNNVGEDLGGRRLVIDLTNVTVIGRDGEDVLFELLKQGAKFSCGGVLTKYVLKRLERRCRVTAETRRSQRGMRKIEA